MRSSRDHWRWAGERGDFVKSGHCHATRARAHNPLRCDHGRQWATACTACSDSKLRRNAADCCSGKGPEGGRDMRVSGSVAGCRTADRRVDSVRGTAERLIRGVESAQLDKGDGGWAGARALVLLGRLERVWLCSRVCCFVRMRGSPPRNALHVQSTVIGRNVPLSDKAMPRAHALRHGSVHGSTASTWAVAVRSVWRDSSGAAHRAGCGGAGRAGSGERRQVREVLRGATTQREL